MSAALWKSNDKYKPIRCGLSKSCPRQYKLSDVNASALEWGTAAADEHIANQERGKMWATSRCKTTYGRHADPIRYSVRSHDMASAGAWCLPTSRNGTVLRGMLVKQPHGHSYIVPGGHSDADVGLVREVYRRLLAPRVSGGRVLSILDLGAGVGQFGHSLLSMHPHARYRGYDGSGNIDELTGGFVGYADLSQPMEIRPRADWVVSLEVAEHLPNQRESFYIRNLHAHNCVGLLISWGVLGQGGLAHINNHPPEYLTEIFEGLGYRTDEHLASQLLNASDQHYTRLHAFRRLQPPPGCENTNTDNLPYQYVQPSRIPVEDSSIVTNT